jgi:hypothetical protein
MKSAFVSSPVAGKRLSRLDAAEVDNGVRESSDKSLRLMQVLNILIPMFQCYR